jgi:hypothetical protein
MKMTTFWDTAPRPDDGVASEMSISTKLYGTISQKAIIFNKVSTNFKIHQTENQFHVTGSAICPKQNYSNRTMIKKL